MQTVQQFREKFRVEELTVLALDHWTWSLRPVHATLASSIFSLNRSCQSFSRLTSEEAAELPLLAAEFEQRTRALFNAQKFNYIMLMMVDDHVHFHCIPRYGSETLQLDRSWSDNGWPGPPVLTDGADLAQDPILQDICKALKQRP